MFPARTLRLSITLSTPSFSPQDRPILPPALSNHPSSTPFPRSLCPVPHPPQIFLSAFLLVPIFIIFASRIAYPIYIIQSSLILHMPLYQTPRNEQIPDLPRRLMSTILTYTFGTFRPCLDILSSSFPASRNLGPAAQHPVYVRHRYPDSQMAKKHKKRRVSSLIIRLFLDRRGLVACRDVSEVLESVNRLYCSCF